MVTITTIRTALLMPAAALLALTGVRLAAGAGTTAQATGSPATAPAIASVAGHWLHDSQGNVIGGVQGSADGGRTAVLMIGSYFQPGSHEIRVPASQLSVASGQVRPRPEISEALNVLPQR